MKEAIIGIPLGNALRSIADAMNLKAPDGDLGLLCPECRKPVIAYDHGLNGPHFAHRERNLHCPLSDL